MTEPQAAVALEIDDDAFDAYAALLWNHIHPYGPKWHHLSQQEKWSGQHLAHIALWQASLLIADARRVDRPEP